MGDYPRRVQEIVVGTVPSNTGKSLANHVQVANLDHAFRSTRTKVTATFRLSGVPGAGALYVRGARYMSVSAGRPHDAQQGAPQQLCTFGALLVNSADGYPQSFSVDMSGFAELWFDNQTDVDLLEFTIQVETIADPVNEVGP